MAADGGIKTTESLPLLLVVGGSGSIGSATCLLAARRGYAVYVHYHKAHDEAHQVVGQIKSFGGQADTVPADLGSVFGVAQLFEEVDRRGGRLDALVNCAAISFPPVNGIEISEERFARTWSVNVVGAFFCVQYAVRRMLRNQGSQRGAIVNVSSHSARTGGSGVHIDYAASKAALETFTIGFAKEVAASGIRINAVSPGTISDGMSAHLDSAWRAKIEDRIPMKRLGRPEEVARSILWLLSSDASYVTGTVVNVAGGR